MPYCLLMFEKEIILKEQLAVRCLFQCSVDPFDRAQDKLWTGHLSHTLESFWKFSCCSKNGCDFN